MVVSPKGGITVPVVVMSDESPQPTHAEHEVSAPPHDPVTPLTDASATETAGHEVPTPPHDTVASPANATDPLGLSALESVSEPHPTAALSGESEPEPEPVTAEVPTVADPVSETAPVVPTPPASLKKWYIVKVQSGREESIKAAIERKVKIEGLEEFYGQIVIPVEEFVEKKKVKVKVKDKKTGTVETVTQEKNVVKYRKKFHGYLFTEVEFNDRILYLFRETSGVGDFVGGAGPLKPPPPMPDHEVQQMLTGIPTGDQSKKSKVAVKLDFEKGDRVRIKDGAFSGSEAEVKEISLPKDPTDSPKIKVVVTIWGRPVDVEMDYWHVDKI